MAARENNTKGFLLRLDPGTMKLVEAWAAREFRSVNGQLQWIIHDSLRRHGMLREADSKKDGGNPRTPQSDKTNII